jgi:uncharacterized membrane protein
MSINRKSSDHNQLQKLLDDYFSITDSAGNLIYKTVKPLALEFKLKDLVQQIVGATLLAIPLAYTEEVWNLGEQLPINNIYAISLISFSFISLFVYYNYYKKNFRKYFLEFFKRSFSTYLIALGVSFLILSLIDKAPLGTEWLIAFKRMVILSLPASMSAAVTDSFK